MNIDYNIGVCDEYNAITKLIPYLKTYLTDGDTIQIISDSDNTTDVVNEYLDSLTDITILTYPFSPIADNVNYYKSKCHGDFIFCLSADETPHEYLLQNIKNILTTYSWTDGIAIPRINIYTDLNIETSRNMYIGNRDKDYLLKEPVNEHGWHHWPDYQMRLIKNVPYIQYSTHTHGGLIGFKNPIRLPATEQFALLHKKTVAQQSRSNMACDKIEQEKQNVNNS